MVYTCIHIYCVDFCILRALTCNEKAMLKFDDVSFDQDIARRFAIFVDARHFAKLYIFVNFGVCVCVFVVVFFFCLFVLNNILSAVLSLLVSPLLFSCYLFLQIKRSSLNSFQPLQETFCISSLLIKLTNKPKQHHSKFQ